MSAVMLVGLPYPFMKQGLGQSSYGSSMSILTGFPPMSAGLSLYLDWLPRFASNWTHQGRSTPEVAQCLCRFCPKPCTAVYLLSNLSKPAPNAQPTNGAIAFSSGGSHCRSTVHARVAALTGRSGGVAMLPAHEPKGEPMSTARFRRLSAAAAVLAIFGSWHGACG